MNSLFIFIPLDADKATTMKYNQNFKQMVENNLRTDPLLKNCVVLASPPIPAYALTGSKVLQTESKKNINIKLKIWLSLADFLCANQFLSGEVMTTYSELLEKYLYNTTQYYQEPAKDQILPIVQSWYDMVSAMLCIKRLPSSQKLGLRYFKKVVLIGDQDFENGDGWKTEDTVLKNISIRISTTNSPIDAFKKLSEELRESENTLFIILTDSTNWLTFQSFCTHMNHNLINDNSSEDLNMYELESQYMVDGECQASLISNYIILTKEFVRKASEYIHSESAIIFTPIIPQWIICPGTDTDVLTSLHSHNHHLSGKPLFPVFHPKLTSKEVISYLNIVDESWTACVKHIMEMQQIPSELVDLYVQHRSGGIAESINSDICCEDRSSVAAYPCWQGLMYAFVRLLTIGPERRSVETTLQKEENHFERVVLIGSFAKSMVSYLQLPNVSGINAIINFDATDLTDNKEEVIEFLKQKPKSTLFIFLITLDSFSPRCSEYKSKSFQSKNVPFKWIETNINFNSNYKSDFEKAATFLKNFQAQLIGLDSVAVFIPLCPQLYYKAPSSDERIKAVKEFCQTMERVKAAVPISPLIIP
ncbi:unnamed protein product, partial [Meganyctiphanes norvegica]